MAARKTVPWTVSVEGRRVVRGVVGVVVGGTFLAHYLPQSWLLDQTQQVTQAYRKGKSIPVAPYITELVQEVMGDMGMAEEARAHVKLYTGYGFEVYHAGSVSSPHGAILGVPLSMKWVDMGDFDPTGIVVNQEPVNWSTKPGESLKDALILSREAKKFSLARELHGIESDPIITHALIPPLSLTISYTIAMGINKRLGLYNKPMSLRVCLYVLSSLFGYAVYILGTDMGNVKKEADSDEATCGLGKAYVQGGVEFYEKTLQRNVALRELMGKDGEALFTAYGNPEVLFRTKHLPITMRLDYMKNKLKKLTDGATDDANTDGKR